MINVQEVIRIRIPFPFADSDLATNAHMYIVKEVNGHDVALIKCQSFKPYMLRERISGHYIDESADIARNPFRNKTRIDCDKVFVTQRVAYNDSLKTKTRPDICNELMEDILRELIKDSYNRIFLNDIMVSQLNVSTTLINT